jgi:hypothetical protein
MRVGGAGCRLSTGRKFNRRFKEANMERVGKRTWGVLWIALFLAVMGMPSLGIAQTATQPVGDKPAATGDDDWRFLFYMPVWIPAMSGTVGVRGLNAPVDVDQIESWDNVRYWSVVPLAGHMEIKKGPFSVMLDGLFARYKEDVSGGSQIALPIHLPVSLPRLRREAVVDRLIRGDFSGEITVKTGYSVNDVSLLYDVYQTSERVGNDPALTLQALAGFRYTYLQTRIDGNASLTLLTPLGPVSRSFDFDVTGTKDWYDPIVGGRLLWNFDDHWMLGFRADFGGFTLVSEFQTNLDAWVTYRVNDRYFANVGFRALYDNYESGSGGNRFKYDLWAYGPWVGFGAKF